jgi:hypothetical protein
MGSTTSYISGLQKYCFEISQPIYPCYMVLLENFTVTRLAREVEHPFMEPEGLSP